MREIKFRAWDKTNERMVTPVCGTNWSANISSGNIIDTYKDCLQYTDWDDMYGKRICQGDIVKGIWECGDLMICEVKKEQNGEYLFYKLGTIGYAKPTEKYLSTCEVIGNIYETPELLNN